LCSDRCRVAPNVLDVLGKIASFGSGSDLASRGLIYLMFNIELEMPSTSSC
jgi:hypothetical protein